jgi:hypothetical protein
MGTGRSVACESTRATEDAVSRRSSGVNQPQPVLLPQLLHV